MRSKCLIAALAFFGIASLSQAASNDPWAYYRAQGDGGYTSSYSPKYKQSGSNYYKAGEDYERSGGNLGRFSSRGAATPQTTVAPAPTYRPSNSYRDTYYGYQDEESSWGIRYQLIGGGGSKYSANGVSTTMPSLYGSQLSLVYISYAETVSHEWSFNCQGLLGSKTIQYDAGEESNVDIVVGVYTIGYDCNIHISDTTDFYVGAKIGVSVALYDETGITENYYGWEDQSQGTGSIRLGFKFRTSESWRFDVGYECTQLIEDCTPFHFVTVGVTYLF